MHNNTAKPKVYIVGSGIGDPGLITLRARAVLECADVIIHDYLTDDRILQFCRLGSERISCAALGKKRYGGSHSNAQEHINTEMINQARSGKKVVRLKNGDPVLFARFAEELQALRDNDIAYEVVPGITAASAAAAYMGVPLTDRRCASHVAFVTGHGANERDHIDWPAMVHIDTLVLYMAVKNIGQIAQKLMQAGKNADTPVAVISNIATVHQKSAQATLATIAEVITRQQITAPAIFIIGEVARFETTLDWMRTTPKALFTGLSYERYFLDEIFFHVPMIQIIPMESYEQLDNQIHRMETFDWLVFGSRYGVMYFFQRLTALGYDTRALHSVRIAAVGQSTAGMLQQFGITADLVPEKETSSGLLEAFANITITDKHILLPRSDLSDKGLAAGLEQLGAHTTSVNAYRNSMPEMLPELNFELFDEIYFTSPSTVRNFLKRYTTVPAHLRIRCIGEVTEREARKWKLID